MSPIPLAGERHGTRTSNLALDGAARDVDDLVDELELTLDDRQRRLLHQLRLSAETLGAVRATSMWWSDPRQAPRAPHD
jgi:hypothetical protein